MNDAVGDLVGLIATSVVWRVVGQLVRDLPLPLQLVAGVAAAGAFVWWRKSRGRRSSRSAR